MNPTDIASAEVTPADVTEESLVYELDLEAPIDKVWHALTCPEVVRQWLLPPPNEAGDDIELRLAECRPPHYVAYHWQDEDEPHSLVTFELQPAASGRTLLRLTHRRAAFGAATLRMAA